MVIAIAMVSTIMRPMMTMITTAEPISNLMMARKIVAKITTDMMIILLATTMAHPKMAPILLLLLTIIMRTVILTVMSHPTMAD